jgi:hypothetical protein
VTIRRLLRIVCSVVGATFLLAPAAAAAPAQGEAPVTTTAWYWETQRSQKVTDPTSGADVATLEAPNPFCPSTSAGGPPPESGACQEGRLPVEVQGSDYEEPDKISAVGFDLSIVPLGGEVRKMTATFLEANDRQSDPINAEGKQLQACIVEEFFGGGNARQYDEAPQHTCSPTDPVAKRKPVKVKNEDGEQEDRFQYTFDLTALAAQWVEAGDLQGGIMIYPAQPKDPDPSSDANWRVVLTGADEQEEKGVITRIVYTEPDPDGALGGGLEDLGEFESDGGGGTFGSAGGSDFGDSSGSGDDFGDTAGDTAEEPTEEGEPEELSLAGEQASDTAPVETLPGYVWLAILAGLVAFSLVKQAVLESAAGIRPDGVLAQIRRLNAERRGAPIEEIVAGTSGRFDPVIRGLKNLGGHASGFVSKLPWRRKG